MLLTGKLVTNLSTLSLSPITLSSHQPLFIMARSHPLSDPAQFILSLSDGEQIAFTCSHEWELCGFDMGRAVDGDDVAIIREMFEAAESERNKELDEQISIIGEALDAMNHYEDEKWYRRTDTWTRILPGAEDEKEWAPHRVWSHFMLWPLAREYHFDHGKEIEAVLAAAEEDFDYEQWINSAQYVKSLEEYNRHKLLACACSNHLWVGKYTDENTFSVGNTSLSASFVKDRYKVNGVVRTDFPNQWGNPGYAKASSDYGDIYIPHKFCGYIGQPGTPVTMTVALQDVGGDGHKGNGFRWTCIYIH